MPRGIDIKLLNICLELEKLNLSLEDGRLVLFIKGQLEDDWRKRLVNTLSHLCKKYVKIDGWKDDDIPEWYWQAIKDIFLNERGK